MNSVQIRIDDLRGPEVAALLQEHLDGVASVTPEKSRHALNLDELRQPGITFWTAWIGAEIAGCAALRELDASHAELKSMRTTSRFLRQGVGSALLEHIIAEARRRGYRRLSLETAVFEYFVPAHRLYHKFGFRPCGPFEGYAEDPNSHFTTMIL
jgi:putative acetyltransferase